MLSTVCLPERCFEPPSSSIIRANRYDCSRHSEDQSKKLCRREFLHTIHAPNESSTSTVLKTKVLGVCRRENDNFMNTEAGVKTECIHPEVWALGGRKTFDTERAWHRRLQAIRKGTSTVVGGNRRVRSASWWSTGRDHGPPKTDEGSGPAVQGKSIKVNAQCTTFQMTDLCV